MTWEDDVRRMVALVATFLAAHRVSACTVCESETGRQVRSGIFGGDFGQDLFLTLLPFPVLLAIVALIHFGFPWPRRASRSGAVTGGEES